MIHDQEISELHREKTELDGRFNDCRLEIVKANAVLTASVDMKAIQKATSTKAAAITARENIQKRLKQIDETVADFRNKQRMFKEELAAVPGRIAALKDRLTELQRRKASEQHTLGVIETKLASTEKRFGVLPKAPTWDYGDGDAAAIPRALLKKDLEHQQFHTGRLSAEIPIIERQIGEVETQIGKLEQYLEGLKQMA